MHAIAHDQRANRRIGRGAAQVAASKAQRRRHIGFVSVQIDHARSGALSADALSSDEASSDSSGAIAAARDEFVDERVEVLRLAKIAIDRGEAHVSDGIERAQPFDHEFADLGAIDFRIAGALQLAHDAIDHLLDALGIDRRLRRATSSERISLSRSKGARRPDSLMTTSSPQLARARRW